MVHNQQNSNIIYYIQNKYLETTNDSVKKITVSFCPDKNLEFPVMLS